jgi:hypothetical protein
VGAVAGAEAGHGGRVEAGVQRAGVQRSGCGGVGRVGHGSADLS